MIGSSLVVKAEMTSNHVLREIGLQLLASHLPVITPFDKQSRDGF